MTRRGRLHCASRLLLVAALPIVIGALSALVVAWCFALWENVGAAPQQTRIGVASGNRVYEVKLRRGIGVRRAEISAGVASAETERPSPVTWPPSAWLSPGPLNPPPAFGPGLLTNIHIFPAREALPAWTATRDQARGLGLSPPDMLVSPGAKSYVTINGSTLVFDSFFAETGAGWPAICLRSRATAAGATTHALVLPTWVGKNIPGVVATTLPREVVWSGLLLDALVFALPWWALVGCGPGRRAWRAWRGRCPSCAYNLRGGLASGCPECGWRRQGP